MLNKFYNKQSFLSWSCLFAFSSTIGCAAINSSPKEERHQMELSVHKLRTDLEDIKHDLNTNEIQVHILEGKLLDQEETVVDVRQKVAQLESATLEDFSHQLSMIIKKNSLLEKKQEEILSDLRQLMQHANQTTTALAQYKEKMQEVEKQVSMQNTRLEEVSKLKKTINAALEQKSFKESTGTYLIKEGDSLEKIAKQFSTSVDELKRLNHLNDSLILAGHELLVPKL